MTAPNKHEITFKFDSKEEPNFYRATVNDNGTRLYCLDYINFDVIHCIEVKSTKNIEYYCLNNINKNNIIPKTRSYYGSLIYFDNKLFNSIWRRS